MTMQHQQTAKPKTNAPMQAFKCRCGIVLGWTDGKILAVGGVSFEKVVTGKCAGCGKCNRWTPAKVSRAA
jgi:hypothetical protein